MNCKNLLQFVMASLLALFITAGVGASDVFAQVTYVDSDADPNQADGSSANPYADLANGYFYAGANGTVIIEAGTYDALNNASFGGDRMLIIVDDEDRSDTQSTVDFTGKLEFTGSITIDDTDVSDRTTITHPTINVGGGLTIGGSLALATDLTVGNITNDGMI